MPPIAVILALITLIQWSFLAFWEPVKPHSPFSSRRIARASAALPVPYTYRTWRIPFRTFSIGVWGIFGYHFSSFWRCVSRPRLKPISSLSLAAADRRTLSLIPQGISLASPSWPRSRSGLLGAGLIVSGGKLQLDIHHLDGYLLALCAAVSGRPIPC
jgi:hypothetical protein